MSLSYLTQPKLNAEDIAEFNRVHVQDFDKLPQHIAEKIG